MYLSGASISLIVITSIPSSSITIEPTLINPFSSVVYVLSFPLLIFTPNFAPANFFVLSCASTFTSCNLYNPGFFLFGTVTVIVPLSSATVEPCFCSSVVSDENSTLLTT